MAKDYHVIEALGKTEVVVNSKDIEKIMGN